MRKHGLLSLVLLAGTGCSSVASSVVATGAAGPRIQASPEAIAAVRVSATQLPAGAAELGIIEAHGGLDVNLPDIMNEFRSQVAGLGGNYGKIDRVASRFEMRTETYSYTCGKNTCTGTRQVEVCTTSVQGHAYKTEKTKP